MIDNTIKKTNDVTGIEWIANTKSDKAKYLEIFQSVAFSNIPQDWEYGTTKHTTEKSDVKRGIIISGEKPIGAVQILVKKKHGIPFAVRINRGPLFLDEYDIVENHIEALKIIRKKLLFRLLPFSYAPNVQYSPINLIKMSQDKWRMLDVFGYETGVIDLHQSEEDIRKNLNGKWRNQLKSAEKAQLKLKLSSDRFDEIVSIYELSQKEKGFEGIPSDVLFDLKNKKNSPLDVFYIVDDEDEIIAFDIFYRTSNFGLYLVGWNNETGRKHYANNLLLYSAACYFKQEGQRWLDLGGIDYIDTEENARFKDGMNPQHIRYVGEFVKVL